MIEPSQPVNVPMALPPASLADVSARFARYRRLAVRQKRRWLEVLLLWEQKSSYGVFDEEGRHVLQVSEDGGGLGDVLKRLFLGRAGPFSSTVWDNPIPRPLLRLRRPFRFIFHRLDVATAGGERIGSSERRWSWVRCVSVIQDEEGRPLAELVGPFFSPWTFEITVGDRVVGTLRKRWSGALKELVTDADDFALEMAEAEPQLKVLAFAATVLIDVVHFERAQRS